MILVESSSPARVKQHGEEESVVISAGMKLTIETSPGGIDILDETVPAGKQWVAKISVDIDETDV